MNTSTHEWVWLLKLVFGFIVGLLTVIMYVRTTNKRVGGLYLCWVATIMLSLSSFLQLQEIPQNQQVELDRRKLLLDDLAGRIKTIEDRKSQ